MKVVEKIERNQENQDGAIIFSFEYFTPKPGHATVSGFVDTVTAMSRHGPSFCDITWRPRDPYPALTLELAGRMQAEVGVETMMHLTCVGMPVDRIDYALDTARAKGVRNILALRGDLLPGMDSVGASNGDGFTSALDLVKYIRSKHGDYFGITVAGYPEAHPSQIPDGSEEATEEGYESDLAYLKQKVDAGADLIITQLFFDAEVFIKFVKDCRRIGITCPIVPGILPFASFRSFKFMTETCKTKVPKEVRAKVEAARGDDAALAAYGVELATEICRKILKETGVKALHFYTMNKEAPAVGVLRNLGLLGVTQNEKKLEEKVLVGN
ncbi:putative methylenetetrahydrofolate reductase [Iris pallida]|uniref:Methylenetetrahydrofolate reductase n=1 Tax=Iris pallida TaxID=29817 RepID=A0AAX6FEX8_IRIPA|nr:putative methylenetetrahydrofolate reductase [Iris pallida]